MEYNKEILFGLQRRIKFEHQKQMDEAYLLCLEHYKNKEEINVSVVNGIINFLDLRLKELNNNYEDIIMMSEIEMFSNFFIKMKKFRIIAEKRNINNAKFKLKMELVRLTRRK